MCFKLFFTIQVVQIANDFGLHGLAPTISYTKKKTSKPVVKGREDGYFLTPYWEFVPQERRRVANGSRSHSTFRGSVNQVNQDMTELGYSLC